MKKILICVLLAVPLMALAAPRKPVKAVPAVPAQPVNPTEAKKPTPPLINSDLGGRDMQFVAQAIDLGKALRYLAMQIPRTSNPSLRGFGDDLVKTLGAQSKVLNAVAEMRQVKVSEAESVTEKRIAERISKLEGIRLEKAILDAFLEVDRQAVATYEIGAKSEDPTIREFVAQTLPQARGHLALVQTMAGIAPNKENITKPLFRTKVALPPENQSTDGASPRAE